MKAGCNGELKTTRWRSRATALAFLCTASLAAPVAFGGDAAERFAAVLAANPEVPVVCSFTVWSESSERPNETREERFAANEDGGQWQLVAVNGEPPSQSDLDDYANTSRERERRSNADGFSLEGAIDEQSVSVESEDAQTITFSFTPTEDSAPEPQKVAGTLVVDKATLRALRFAIANTDTISPAPTVKMQEFRQEFDFTVDAATDALLVESMRMAAHGRAMVFKKISVEAELRFSDYDCRI